LLKSKFSISLSKARVATLGTENPDGTVHLVPIVFASDQRDIYFVVDRKPKTRPLRRIGNIERTGRATLLVQHYSENWNKLSFLLVYCEARILRRNHNLEEKKRASRMLKKKYSQYRSNKYFPEDLASATFVLLIPRKYVEWPHFLRRNQP
jgi:PPOX class probable F420-dependent enzyme